MKKLFLLIFVTILFLLPFLSAAEPSYIFKQNEAVDLKTACFTAANEYCNSSVTCKATIYYPNQSILINNQNMTWNVNYFNYSLTPSQTSILGTYPIIVNCLSNQINVSNGFSTFDYEITANGNKPPSGIVIVLFSLLFIIILAGLVVLFLYGIGHFKDLNMDVKDIAYNIGGYFALLGIYGLSLEYMGSPLINNFLDLIIKIGAVTNVFLPIIAFILSITIGQLGKMANRNE
jgi:hypothetical protein